MLDQTKHGPSCSSKAECVKQSSYRSTIFSFYGVIRQDSGSSPWHFSWFWQLTLLPKCFCCSESQWCLFAYWYSEGPGCQWHCIAMYISYISSKPSGQFVMSPSSQLSRCFHCPHMIWYWEWIGWKLIVQWRFTGNRNGWLSHTRILLLCYTVLCLIFLKDPYCRYVPCCMAWEWDE